MKKIFLSVIIHILIFLFVFAGCDDKYCDVSNCPKQHTLYSNYCAEHKCVNRDCKNRSTYSYGFCTTCLNRGN